ncbi:MAG: PAS domain S-box protein, partial [Elusimicrobia bacterium]|nr:PAS domain S-box protein [Elusimicrobiota bacterium]
ITDYAGILDRRQRILLVNRVPRGRKLKELLGMRACDFVAPEFRPDWHRRFRRVLRTGRPVCFESRSAGVLRSEWCEVRLGAIPGRRLVTIVLSIVTARREGEERLRRSEDLFHSMFEGCREAIAFQASDGTFLRVNAAYERLTGYKREELVGKMRFQDLTAPEFHASDREFVRKLIAKGGFFEFEKEYIRRDGRRVPAHITVYSVRTPDGKPAGFRVFIRDITQLKQAERDVIRMEREVLEAGAHEQRRIAQDLHDSLGQKLTGISLLSQALHQRLAARGAPEAAGARKVAEYAARAVRESRELAQGLLPVELGGGLGGALRVLAGYARDAFQVSCAVRLAEGADSCDDVAAMNLYRIAQEAVSNAIRHGRARNIDIDLRAKSGGLILTVTDDGRGIEPEGARKRGLGLQIMRHRARMVGAALDIERADGSGTIVTCRLPAA